MGIVIEYPVKGKAKSFAVLRQARATAGPPAGPSLKTERTHFTRFKIKAIPLLLLKGVWASVWFVLVCLWPIGRWIAGIDLCFQLIRTAYFWNTPNVYAGWTFLLHFAVFSALTYLVAAHRPAGFRRFVPPGPSREENLT